jgi:EpsI family protein
VTKLAALIAASMLGLNTYVFYFMGSEEAVPTRSSFDAFPLTLAEWECPTPDRMEEKIERRLGVTDYWLCSYTTSSEPGGLVGVYLGYHERQVREGAKSSAESSIHPPRHCLPGSGWDIIHSEVTTLDVPEFPSAEVNRLIIAKGPARQLVYYWYQERGRVIASDYFKIVYLFWDRATRARSDGALVRFTIPIGREGEEAADAAFRSLAGEMLPLIPKYIPG